MARQRAAAGKLDGAERTGDAAQLAADAQAFIELDSAVNAGDGVDRADLGAGGVFAVMTELRRGVFTVTHHFQPRLALQAMLAMVF